MFEFDIGYYIKMIVIFCLLFLLYFIFYVKQRGNIDGKVVIA